MKWLRHHIFLAGVSAVVLVGVGFFLFEQFKVSTTTAELINPDTSKVQSAMSGTSTDKGNSPENQTDRNALQTYSVAADQPRALYINALSIAARIKPMGLTTDNSIKAPTNIYDSGWYTGSAKPGGDGAAFIDGHASGATRMGLFAYLDTLKTGDQLSVEMGDGTRFAYQVKAVTVVPKNDLDMTQVLSTYGGAKKGLNLMTCTGKWIESEKTYDHRVVVYTEQIS